MDVLKELTNLTKDDALVLAVFKRIFNSHRVPAADLSHLVLHVSQGFGFFEFSAGFQGAAADMIANKIQARLKPSTAGPSPVLLG